MGAAAGSTRHDEVQVIEPQKIAVRNHPERNPQEGSPGSSPGRAGGGSGREDAKEVTFPGEPTGRDSYLFQNAQDDEIETLEKWAQATAASGPSKKERKRPPPHLAGDPPAPSLRVCAPAYGAGAAQAAAGEACGCGTTAEPHRGHGWERLFDHIHTPHTGAEKLHHLIAVEKTMTEISSTGPTTPVACDYAQVLIKEPAGLRYGPEAAQAAQQILKCLEIRKKYVGPHAIRHVDPSTVRFVHKSAEKVARAGLIAQFDGDNAISLADNDGGGRRMIWEPFAGTPPPLDPNLRVTFEDGIFVARDQAKGGAPVDDHAIVKVAEFCADYLQVSHTMRNRGCASFCLPRLQELDLRFQLHAHHNAKREALRQQETGGRDWYQVRKVDTHIHHSASFSQRQLMQFIRRKMSEENNMIVAEEKGKLLTLREVFSTAGVKDAECVNADKLCCMASIGAGQYDTFGRFDVFNSKYNPFGDKRLRDIFLKTDNYLEGRYLAELTKEVMATYAKGKFVNAEWRISIYGRNTQEWTKLARWFRRFDIQCPQIRWLIQVPRLYPLFRKMGIVRNFAEMLRNIFEPLFQASVDPAGHEDIFLMLQQVVGIDSVDDESEGSQMTLKSYPSPEEWDSEANPPYTYWMFHMYANLRSLNALRRRRGLNTFKFRPHCGEAGNVSHLCSGFMLADGVCHGVQLEKDPVLQYLYYLAQVGIAVSPLSNDILFVPLQKSPFGSFFRRGLNVSLSTDDPLIIHLTEEALIEEYVVSARTFRLSSCDLCEIARNSVLQSGFERAFKYWWVGEPEDRFHGNDEMKTNVPNIRLRFRADCLRNEFSVLEAAAQETS